MSITSNCPRVLSSAKRWANEEMSARFTVFLLRGKNLLVTSTETLEIKVLYEIHFVPRCLYILLVSRSLILFSNIYLLWKLEESDV